MSASKYQYEMCNGDVTSWTSRNVEAKSSRLLSHLFVRQAQPYTYLIGLAISSTSRPPRFNSNASLRTGKFNQQHLMPTVPLQLSNIPRTPKNFRAPNISPSPPGTERFAAASQLFFFPPTSLLPSHRIIYITLRFTVPQDLTFTPSSSLSSVTKLPPNPQSYQ